MTTKLRLMALALVVALFSVQCTKDDSGAPIYPTSIDSHFASGSYEYDGIKIPYRDGVTLASTQGTAPLVVVLHGQYASGSTAVSEGITPVRKIMMAPSTPH